MSVRRLHVVAALVRRGDTVLVQQRRPGDPRGLLWEFPGGKVEQGESELQALERECREEMGIEVAAEAACDRSVHAYPDLELVLIRWRIVSGEPQALHANAVRFAPAAGRPRSRSGCLDGIGLAAFCYLATERSYTTLTDATELHALGRT